MANQKAELNYKRQRKMSGHFSSCICASNREGKSVIKTTLGAIPNWKMSKKSGVPSQMFLSERSWIKLTLKLVIQMLCVVLSFKSADQPIIAQWFAQCSLYFVLPTPRQTTTTSIPFSSNLLI